MGSITIIQGDEQIMGSYLSESISLPDSYSPNATNCTSVGEGAAPWPSSGYETCQRGRSALCRQHRAVLTARHRVQPVFLRLIGTI